MGRCADASARKAADSIRDSRCGSTGAAIRQTRRGAWAPSGGVVKAIEKIEEADGGNELDDIAFVAELAEAFDEFVGDVVGIEGRLLGE